MSDEINVAKCPNCSQSTKLQFAFIYTNVKQQFAVWSEPKYDRFIDEDAAMYTKMFGAENYLANAV
jgi:hypothetical protein